MKTTLTPATQALLILVLGAAAIQFGGTSLKQSLLAKPAYQVLQRDPPAQTSTAKMDKINVIQEEIVAAQPGHDAARAVVENDHGDLGAVAELASLLVRQLGQRLLQLVAQRGRHGGAGRLAGQPGREMRRLHRQGEPAVGRRAAARYLEQE